jgi:hypothetical protein
MRRLIVVLVMMASALVAIPQAEASGLQRLHFAGWPSGDFGYVLVGETQVKKFFVRNSSHRATGALHVSLSGSKTMTVPRRLDYCSGRNLHPGQRCRITVRFTPEFEQGPAPYYLLSGDAAGSLKVTGKRQPHQSATRSLTGVGETPAMRIARPVCESAQINGTLTPSQITSLWTCTWPYLNEDDFNGKWNALAPVCALSGALTLTGNHEQGTAYSTCTSEGG